MRAASGRSPTSARTARTTARSTATDPATAGTEDAMSANQQSPTLLLPPEERRKAQGLGITWKIFLSTALVVVLAIAVAVLWSSSRAKDLMDAAVRDAFAAS